MTQPIVGDSAHTRQLLQLIRSVAPTDSQRVDQWRKRRGRSLSPHPRPIRSPRSFVVNCGAIPSELMESELFGQGSLPVLSPIMWAKWHRHGGTLFLDEIGDMPMSMQVKLLRVLQEKSCCRLGPTSLSTSTLAAYCRHPSRNRRRNQCGAFSCRPVLPSERGAATRAAFTQPT